MVWITITVMVVALSGLVVLQASLLRSAFDQKEQVFRQNVQAAMADMAHKLEAAETVTATLHVIGNAYEILINRQGAAAGTEDDTVTVDTLARVAVGVAGPSLGDFNGATLKAYCDSIARLDCARTDTLAWGDTCHDNSSTTIMIRVSSDTIMDSLPRRLWNSQDPQPIDDRDSGRIHLIQKVIDRLETDGKKPLESRLSASELDSLLRGSFEQYGVEPRPVYAVQTSGDGTLRLVSRAGYESDLINSEFRTRLYPNDFMSASNDLLVFFPDRTSYLIRQIGLIIAATVFFMGVIVAGFAYAVRTIVGQRRAARQMVEFVNNMTHEFKTPISTVALACEAILRHDVIADGDRVRRFSRMIQDENRRMRNQVEKILQMAALEERQGSLQMAVVDAHSVIRAAVESVRLQVEHRGGSISCDLHCRNPLVAADEVHLTGVIFNLLDNANKYSPESPTIRVITDDCDRGIRIMVTDNGLGLKTEDRRRIFDKYYRVQQGNVHDVKGFGLGLSYVALIVRAHRGRIDVDSEPGKGTKMILWLPSADAQCSEVKS